MVTVGIDRRRHGRHAAAEAAPGSLFPITGRPRPGRGRLRLHLPGPPVPPGRHAAQAAGWDDTATNRLQLAGEEAFLYLLERQSESEPRPIRVAVRSVDDVLQMEFVSGPDDVNLEVRLGKLDDDLRGHQGRRTAHPSVRGEGGEARAVLRCRHADRGRGHPTTRVRAGGRSRSRQSAVAHASPQETTTSPRGEPCLRHYEPKGELWRRESAMSKPSRCVSNHLDCT